ncbi:hypothetical protein ACERK3_19490 [Phycisphaerales bacterium AB-hyl4]|uniref:Uncharacterized protein n=1 Tax=Natronomicrosphaera hydrolytica TaxID=3242702 RepID=A0ABV4UA68_9BACT
MRHTQTEPREKRRRFGPSVNYGGVLPTGWSIGRASLGVIVGSGMAI